MIAMQLMNSASASMRQSLHHDFFSSASRSHVPGERVRTRYKKTRKT